MLDLLLAAEQNGLIDDAGVKEEVATFVFEVSLFWIIFSIILVQYFLIIYLNFRDTILHPWDCCTQ